MRLRFSLRRFAIAALLAGLPPLAGAAVDAGASRADVERWFGTLRAAHDMAAPQRWEYSFVADDGRALESLSVALVHDGYEIRTLDARVNPVLRVTKTELHSPLTLVQRNQALQRTAHKHQARYVAVDIAS